MTFKAPEQYRVKNCGPLSSDESMGPNGLFEIPMHNGKMLLHAIATNHDGWNHVSVSHRNRCPTWEEMCFIKNLFWDDEDRVVQYHPPKSEYVNIHPYCLHLWQPNDGQEIPAPPPRLVV